MGRRNEPTAETNESSSDTALTRKVKIVNSLGLHARPSALFVQTANKFPSCRVAVSNGVDQVNGKSIMGMMTLAAAQGTELTLNVVGKEAKGAMDALCQLIANKFDEE